VLVHRTELAGNAAVITGVSEELRLGNAPPPLVLKHDFNRNRLTETLDREVVASGKRPDALLIVNQHHLLTALPHLLHRGLRIPHDISLVYLSNDPVVERLSPLPDRYDLGNRLVRRLAKAVQARLAGETPASASLLPRMLKGETLA
jgi:DNA-binding LacI/PurR family transcriptional regulator